MDAMRYELYFDSLFAVNFIMNLCILALVNQSVFRSATRIRLLLGAGIGALFYFFPLFLVGRGRMLRIPVVILGVILMVVVTFPIQDVRSFFLIIEKLIFYSIVMGGVFLLGNKVLPGLWAFMGMGVTFCGLFSLRRSMKKKVDHLCRATLVCGKNQVAVSGLVDSGNSLVEPISGKPVSIVEQSVVHNLWREEPLFRVIPYHSIGKKKGILKGYCLPELRVEMEGGVRVCKNVYVAVCEEYVPSEEVGRERIRMILNPALLDANIKERG